MTSPSGRTAPVRFAWRSAITNRTTAPNSRNKRAPHFTYCFHVEGRPTDRRASPSELIRISLAIAFKAAPSEHRQNFFKFSLYLTSPPPDRATVTTTTPYAHCMDTQAANAAIRLSLRMPSARYANAPPPSGFIVYHIFVHSALFPRTRLFYTNTLTHRS